MAAALPHGPDAQLLQLTRMDVTGLIDGRRHVPRFAAAIRQWVTGGSKIGDPLLATQHPPKGPNFGPCLLCGQTEMDQDAT